MSTAKTWYIPVSEPVRDSIRRKGPVPADMARNPYTGVPIYGWRYEEFDEAAALRAGLEAFKRRTRFEDTTKK